MVKLHSSLFFIILGNLCRLEGYLFTCVAGGAWVFSPYCFSILKGRGQFLSSVELHLNQAYTKKKIPPLLCLREYWQWCSLTPRGWENGRECGQRGREPVHKTNPEAFSAVLSVSLQALKSHRKHPGATGFRHPSSLPHYLNSYCWIAQWSWNT